MMKKFLVGFLIVMFSSASAQIELRNTRFGFTAGGDQSGVQNAHNPSSKRFGFLGGVLAEIPVQMATAQDQFYIQPEVLYLQAGENGRKSTDQIYQTNYLSVPVWFKGYFSEAESEFFGIIGPRFGFRLNQKVKNPQRPGYEVDGAGAFGKAASFDFAIGGGLGFSYKRQLELRVQYEYGLSNTYPQMDKDFKPSGDPNALSKKHQSIVSLALSYIFN